jgi:ribosome-associated protein YbcJ (S4-like RNA binding protein)
MDGNMKVKSGDVTKISEISLDIQPVGVREENGDKTEIVQGTFIVGMINNAEIEYNVNGTLESHKGEKILSLQGVECNGINNDDSKTIDCNY